MTVKVNPAVEQNQNQNYKKPSTGKKVLASAVGISLAGGVSYGISQGVNAAVSSGLLSAGSVTDDEFKSVSEGVKKILKDTGLEEKCVKAVNTASPSEIREMVTNSINSDPIGKFLPKLLKNFQINKAVSQISGGTNAAYLDAAKTVILPKGNNLALAVFHELGHAANANLSTFSKILAKSRSLSMLSLPISYIALCRTKKAPNDKRKGGVLDFIKNNVGKLTFLTAVPILAEEAMASFKGVGFAKKVLSPELAKKTSKCYKLAFLTYMGLAAGLSVGAVIGNKVRDAIAHPKAANANKK